MLVSDTLQLSPELKTTITFEIPISHIVDGAGGGGGGGSTPPPPLFTKIWEHVII